MTWSRTVNAIRARFLAEVATPNDLVVVQGNQPVDNAELGARWCRLSVQAATRQQVSSGQPGHRRFRLAGVAFAVLLEALDHGDGDQDELVDAIQQAFTGISLSLAGSPAIYLRFRPPFPSGEAQRDSEGPWWARTVQIPFIADDFGGAAP